MGGEGETSTRVFVVGLLSDSTAEVNRDSDTRRTTVTTYRCGLSPGKERYKPHARALGLLDHGAAAATTTSSNKTETLRNTPVFGIIPWYVVFDSTPCVYI